ncbi:MAG: sugar phosphate isomerase/epimerase [Planctomycetes bacterium]|nr:sugar phosphate isomerase/epimerase [Planctomycetota bacterium]
MNTIDRRGFVKTSIGLGAAALSISVPRIAPAAPTTSKMRLGLVTYLWGKDMDLPTLIKSCADSGLEGVETRTQHAHGVEPSLSKAQRAEVKQRFADSPVSLVGYGSNAQYHEADPAKVKHNIELTKQYIHLMHDCGATGVKVKPNGFPKDASREKTIEQIGKALNEVAAYGADYGQKIRVEVHGRGTSELPVMKAIFDVADHPNAGVCWNSNNADLEGEGLKHNFNLVKDRLADTVHIRELNMGDYPYQELFNLFAGIGYSGWILLEARTKPADKVAAMREQLEVFQAMVERAKAK